MPQIVSIMRTKSTLLPANKYCNLEFSDKHNLREHFFHSKKYKGNYLSVMKNQTDKNSHVQRVMKRTENSKCVGKHI